MHSIQKNLAAMLLASQISLAHITAQALQKSVFPGAVNQGPSETTLLQTSDETQHEITDIDIRINDLMEDGDVFKDEMPELLLIDNILRGSQFSDRNFEQLNEDYADNAFVQLGETNPNGPLNIKVLGPYKDTADRSLRFGPHQYGYSKETCAQACPTYKYIALQNNGWCCCDNDLAHATKYGPSSCGDRGGYGCNYIYEVDRTPPEPHDIVDLGPWKDTSQRALPIAKGNSHSYDSCNNACTGHKFFALQYNGECFCGDDENRAKQYGPGNCGKTGGSWCQNIWQRVPPKPKPYKEIGAYRDTGDRAFRQGPHQYGYTADTCHKACNGYKYFALQNNGWCSCESEWAHASRYGKANCGKMGGGWCNYIYENTPFPVPIPSEGGKWVDIGPFKDQHNRAMRWGQGKGFNIETCAAKCAQFKYFALQNHPHGECWCDHDLSHATKYGEGGCGRGGGGWCNYIFKNVEKPVGSLRIKELGPWKDTQNRALAYGPMKAGYNYDSCERACPGFKYFSMQFDYCFCANDYDKVTQYGPGNCGQNGGAWCNFVWERIEEAPKLPAATETYMPIGAWRDNHDRAMRFNGKRGFQTIEQCQLACWDYKYFGLQDFREGEKGAQCFCENDFDHVRKYGKGNCGDKGGGWCNFVYESQPFPQKSKYEGFIVKELGPYKDKEDRAMTRFGPNRGYNFQSCSDACPQYKYFALQDGDQCFCSDDLQQTTKWGKGDCGKNGGGWCNYVYERVPAPPPPPKNETKNYIELGPYKDEQERALRYGPMKSGFTAESCMDACGPMYMYFALQYGGECYCDFDLAHATKYGPGECGKTGGSWCNFIYERLPAESEVSFDSLSFEAVGGFVQSLATGKERAFRIQKHDKKMYIEQCAEACGEYTYFSLQDGGADGKGLCSCENEQSRVGMFGQKIDCPKIGGKECHFVYKQLNASTSEDDGFTMVVGDKTKTCDSLGQDGEKWMYRCWFQKGTEFQMRPYISEIELTETGEIKIVMNETFTEETSMEEPPEKTLEEINRQIEEEKKSKSEAELNRGLIEHLNWRQKPQYRTVEKVKSLNGINVTYTVEEEYFVVDGKEMNGPDYFKWISQQDPHLWQHYWQKVQDYRYGQHMTDEMAACYSERYPDLKKAFNGDFAKLKDHWVKFGINEKRNKFCYKELDDAEAQCYLERFPDIQFTPLEEPNVYLAKQAAEAEKAAKTAQPKPKDAKLLQVDSEVEGFKAGDKLKAAVKKVADKKNDKKEDKKDKKEGEEQPATEAAPTKEAPAATEDSFGDGKKPIPEYVKNPLQYAKDHYDYWGYFEQRNRHCADRLTDIQAKCYLNRHPDLVTAFGKNWKRAKQHYYEFGEKEGRNYHCENKLEMNECHGNETCEAEAQTYYDPKPVKVENEKGTFRCNGDVHYVRKSTSPYANPQTEPMAWDMVSNFNIFSFSSDGTKDIVCENSDYMKDMNPHYWKQCFCELKPRTEPRFCATQNQECKKCNGNVVFGQAFINGKKTSFEEMIAKNYAVLKVEGGQANVRCDIKTLGNPNEKETKHCYCDDVGFLTEERILADQAFWENTFVLEERKKQQEMLDLQNKEQEEEQKRKQAIFDAEIQKVKEEAAKQAEEEKAKFVEEAKSFAEAENKKFEAEKAAMLKQDQLDHERDLEDLKKVQEAELAKKKLEAIEQEKSHANALEKMKLELQAKQAKFDFDKKEHERQLAQKAIEARKLEKEHMKKMEEAQKAKDQLALEMKQAKESQERKAKEEAELARLAVEKQLAEDEARRAATEKARAKAAIEKAIEDAMLEQARLVQQKEAEDAKEIEKVRKQEEQKRLLQMTEHQAEIDKQKAQLEAEKAEAARLRQQAADEAQKAKAAREAEFQKQQAIKKQEEDALNEQRRIEKELLDAQHAAKMAKSDKEIEEHKKKAKEAEDAMNANRILKQQLINQRLELEKQKADEEKKAADAAHKADAAEKKQAAMEAEAKRLKDLADEEKRKNDEEAAKEAAQTAEKAKQMEEKRKADHAAWQAAKAEKEKAAKEAQDAAHMAQLEEFQKRRERDKKAADEHFAKMSEKRKVFEENFKHVWGVSLTGLSLATFDVANKPAGDTLITKLFEKTLIADVHSFSDVTHYFKKTLDGNSRSNTVKETRQRLTAVTADDRVAELIEQVIDVTKDENNNILIRHLQGVSAEYQKWADLQTQELGEAAMKWEQDPFENSKPVSEEHVAKLSDNETKEMLESKKEKIEEVTVAKPKTKEEVVAAKGKTLAQSQENDESDLSGFDIPLDVTDVSTSEEE